MSLQKMYDAVVKTAERVNGQEATQDALNLAAATLQLTNSYVIMKDIEFHKGTDINKKNIEFNIPGENPIVGGDN